MSDQQDVGRHRWDEPPGSNQDPADRRLRSGVTGGQIAGFIGLLVIILLVYLLTGRMPAGDAAKIETGDFLERLLPTLYVTGIGVLLYGFAGISGSSRRGRIIRSVTGFWAGGLLISLTSYLVMGALVPLSTMQERLIIPALLMLLFFILGIFSPFMRIWPLNVPDGQVWMILDAGDHVIAYINEGLRWVRPVDGFQQYAQGGTLVIDIDNEDFFTLDNFPFRVRAKVTCLFNPMTADENMRVALRNMSRATIEDGLRTEIEFIIHNELLGDLRQNIREPGNFRVVLNRIYRDIREAVERRANIGVRLAPLSPINVTLLPTRLISTSSERLISLEAATGGGRLDDHLRMLSSGQLDDRVLRDIVQLAARDGDLSIDYDSDGNVRFRLATGDEVDIGDSLSETLIRAAGVVADAASRRQISGQERPALPAQGQQPESSRGLPAGENWQEIPATRDETSVTLPPDSLPSMPQQQNNAIYVEDEGQTVPPPEDVIDTEADDDGIFRPRRNPIIPEDLPDDL